MVEKEQAPIERDIALWKITCAIRKSEEYENFIYKAKVEHCAGVDTENYYKVRIRDKYTLKSYYKLRNKKRKQQLKSYYHELTGIAA